MKAKNFFKFLVAKLKGNKEGALKAVAELVFSGMTEHSLMLDFNLFSVNAKVHILNCIIAKKPFPSAGAKHLLTFLGYTFFCFYSVNNSVKLPAETHILLTRQFVISNAVEVNTYLCVAPKEVYEAFKAEVKDGFDEFEDLVERMKREVKS
jgi:hypothetical protein